jgi:hypothetical protein
MEWGLLYVIAMHDETRSDVERIAKTYPRLKGIHNAIAQVVRVATEPSGLHARHRAPAIRA